MYLPLVFQLGLAKVDDPESAVLYSTRLFRKIVPGQNIPQDNIADYTGRTGCETLLQQLCN
jgi:hypothetical protein